MPLIQTGPRVVVSVIATGGGDWQVVSTPTGFQGITSALFSDNDYIHGFVRFENGVDWEEYDTDDDTSTNLLQIANVTGTVTITRPATPYASSNGGSRVVDTTGTHTMAISLGSGTMKRILREINGSWKTLTSGDATPDVSDYRLFKTAGSTTITAFDAMEDGKLFVVQRGASDITIADGATISLPGDRDLTLTADQPAALFVEDNGIAVLVAMFPNLLTVQNGVAASEVTISSGAITPTQATHSVDTEGDAASDDLDTITGTNFKIGDVLTIYAENSARTVVLKSGTGNIVLPQSMDVTLDDSNSGIMLRYDGTNFNYLAGGVHRPPQTYYPAVAADDTGDWGAEIQAAIDLAEAAGGGSVILPPGIIATTTVLTIEKSGVKLIGQGNGFFNAGTQPENPTVIKYKGSSGATVITFSPVSGAGNGRVVGGAIDGISVDGNSLAATGILVRSCTQCRFNMGAKNCTSWQLDFSTVASLAVARDVQSNEIPFLGAEATGSAGGVRFGTTTLGANISYMTIGEVWSRHVDGVGIEYGNCDNLKVLLSRAFRYNSGTGFGQVLKAGDGVTTNNSRAVELYNAYANGGIKIEGLDDGSLPAINNLITYDEENATPFPTIGVGATGNRIFSNLGLSAPFPVTGAPATIKFTDRNGATDESVFQIKRETGDLLFQAVSDVQLTGTDGAITASDNTFTSAAAGFTAGMVGERIIISGAGASGADLATSVASYTSATSIEITAAASTTVSGAAFSIGETGGNAFAIVGSGNAITEIDVRGTADLNIAGGSLNFGDTERVDSSGNATFNSLAFDSGATSWVPTWGATSGSLTTVTVASARYQQIGNVVFYSIIATITDNGTGASALTFTLPSTPLYGGAGTGKNTSTGETLNTTIAASNGTATVHKYNATYPVATGNAIRLTGFYIV